MKKVYVASSWRNPYQPATIASLRTAGYDVYDFRHPGEGEAGFSFAQVDPAWEQWSVDEFVGGLKHPIAQHAFERDLRALQWCEVCVLLLPSGMSAHLEAGWCAGQGKPVFVYAPELRQAELMYGLLALGHPAPIHATLEGLLAVIASSLR